MCQKIITRLRELCPFNNNSIILFICVVPSVRSRKMCPIFWSVSVLVCSVTTSVAQYYSIYPTIYSPTSASAYYPPRAGFGHPYAYPNYNSIFTSNALNFGRTPVRAPMYIPETYSYPTLRYDRYGRLTNAIHQTTSTISNAILNCVIAVI